MQIEWKYESLRWPGRGVRGIGYDLDLLEGNQPYCGKLTRIDYLRIMVKNRGSHECKIRCPTTPTFMFGITGFGS
jgi:hypothetical protein